MKAEPRQGHDVHTVHDLDTARREGAASNRSALHRFAHQLQERRVCRAVLSYTLIMWLNVQIGDVVFPMFGLPDWTLRLTVMIGLMGLPLIVFLSWTFQITPRGIVVDAKAQPATSTTPQREADLAINVGFLLLGLVLAAFLLTQFAFADSDVSSSPTLDVGDKPGLDHLTTSVSVRSANVHPSSQALVNGVDAEVRHMLIQMPNITVTSETTEHEGTAGHHVLSASVYTDENQTRVLAHLLDVATDEYVWSTVFNLPAASILDLEKAAAERISAELHELLKGRASAPTQLSGDAVQSASEKRA